MVDPSLLGTAALAVGMLVVVAVLLARNRYHHPTLQSDRQQRTLPSRAFGRIDDWSTSPGMWFVSFLLLTLGIGGITVLALVDAPMATVLLGVAAGLTGIGFVLGTYAASRNAGVSTAGSTFLTGTVTATVVLLGVLGLLLVW